MELIQFQVACIIRPTSECTPSKRLRESDGDAKATRIGLGGADWLRELLRYIL
jgi:hypothetical protein